MVNCSFETCYRFLRCKLEICNQYCCTSCDNEKFTYGSYVKSKNFICVKLHFFLNILQASASNVILKCNFRNFVTLQQNSITKQWQEKPFCLGSGASCRGPFTGHILGFGEDELGTTHTMYKYVFFCLLKIIST